MKIAIDARAANTPQPTGVEYYTLKLIENLLDTDRQHKYTLFVSEEITPTLRTLLTAANAVGKVLTPRKFWPLARLPLEFALHSRQYDLFFSPVFAVPYFSAPINVATFHDLAYEFFPKYFAPYERYRQQLFSRFSARKADQLVAVSTSTKNDLVKLYGVDEAKISVIHNAYNEELFIPDVPTKTIQRPPYILFVGTLQGRKGVDRLLRAFDLCKRRHNTNHKLFLVVKKGCRDEKIWTVYQAMKFKSEVILMVYVLEKELTRL